MRKLLGNLGILLGLGCVYLSVLMFVTNTSTNMSGKDYSYIAPVEAKLHFYEDSDSTHEYGNEKNRTNEGIKIYKEGSLYWTSPKYPVEGKYSQLRVIQSDSKPVVNQVLEAVSNITRYSH